MPPRLQAFMSALTQSDHVFLGLPHALEHGTSILVTDLIQDRYRTTCHYQLRAAVTSCKKAVSPALHTTNQWRFNHVAWRHRSIGLLICHFGVALQVWSGRAQVSLPWRRAEQTKASNTFPRTVRDMCLDISIGRSFLNFPQAVQHLVIMAREQPPPELNMSPR